MIYFGLNFFQLFIQSRLSFINLLRWCILGLTEQYVNGKIEFDVYNKYVSELQSHVLRLNHKFEYFR